MSFAFRSVLQIAIAFAAAVASTAAVAEPGSPQVVLAGADLGPFAYTHFCVRYPGDCRRQNAQALPVELTPARRAELVATNAAVNRRIAPAPHAGRGTFDTWTIGPVKGDCNDYAVTKRHQLLAAGWPSGALLLAEAITAWGEHHLVLIARTAQADFVLDNLDPEVRIWTQPNYTWIRAQMPDEPALWARVAPPGRGLSASATTPPGYRRGLD